MSSILKLINKPIDIISLQPTNTCFVVFQKWTSNTKDGISIKKLLTTMSLNRKGRLQKIQQVTLCMINSSMLIDS
jgi:hypothetical protein